MNLPHSLNRSILIQAAPETVFRFFEDSERFARWWGAGSTIDPRRGGRVYIRHPNGVETVGEIVEIAPPERIVFTYGYASGSPIPAGASLVTITLAETAGGTRLDLRHDFADAAARDHHVQGWRFQLSVFANLVADENFAGAAALVDRWFDAWADTDTARREATFAELASAGVTFRDRYSMLDGLSELLPHVQAAQRFMPGVRMTRVGDIRHCQGMVVADWSAGTMGGSSVFQLGPERKIAAVTGFWKS